MGKVLLPKGLPLEPVIHWYLVACRERALIYSGNSRDELNFHRRLENLDATKSERELVSDKPGRVFSSARSEARHSYDPRASHHEIVAVDFARSVCRYLEHELSQRHFTDLVIMAEPHFLGLLHKHFSNRLQATVRKEIHKEWAQGSDRDLADYLRAKLA